MPKAGLWKSIFSQKEKVVVDVGGKPHSMTHTQKFRFEQLKKSERELNAKTYRNPFEDSRYSLDDAAFRLMIDPSELLRKAAAGKYPVYVDVGGVTGMWRRREPNGTISESEAATIQSGVLRLRRDTIQALHSDDGTQVRVLDYCDEAANSDERLDDFTLENLRGWGPGKKQFFPAAPMIIDRSVLILLPPLR